MDAYKIQNSAIKKWTPALAATNVKLADVQFERKAKFDWRPNMDPCHYCLAAPIDTGNTYYDERSNSWLTSGPGNHLVKYCTGHYWRPGMGPCY